MEPGFGPGSLRAAARGALTHPRALRRTRALLRLEGTRLLGAVASVAATALLATAGAASAAGCPNDALRVGLSAELPDCRAYELVSPLGFEPFRLDALGYQAGDNGSRVAFYSKFGAPAGSPSFGPYFLASRRAGGWSTEDVIPPQTTAGGDFCYPAIVFSPDLSQGVLQDGWNWGEGYPKYPVDNGSNNCSHDEPALVAGEPRGAQNVFVRDNATGSYKLVNVTPPEAAPRDAWFQAASRDFSHVVFTDPIQLTADAPVPPTEAVFHYAVGEDLYEWASGVMRLVSLLPDGTPAWGLLANGGESGQVQASATWTHAVSADGERVFFYAGAETFGPNCALCTIEPAKAETYVGGRLYLREHAALEPSPISAGQCTEPAKACTVQIDAAQSGASGASGGGRFQWASADGTKVFFTDDSRLTVDSTAAVGKPDLYEYEVNAGAGGAGTLTDLTVAGPEPANVQGLSGLSEDGGYVYFVADGALTGAQTNSEGAAAQAGRPNLYLRHAATDVFVATLDAFGEDSQEGANEGDTCDWESYSPPGQRLRGEFWGNCMTARVTADGSFLAFNSLRSLTGYDNAVAGSGERNHEIFLYDAALNKLSCVSCDASGAPPTALATQGRDPHIGRPTSDEQWYRTPGYLGHYLSDTGQVFFSTANRLLPGAVNGMMNVYEYRRGQLSLLSSGTSSDDASFRDASANGSDVFFVTTQALVGSDTDHTLSLYDARVNGGFTEPLLGPPACEGEERCQGAGLGPPGILSPTSAGFVGPGNLVPAVGAPGGGKPPGGLACKKGFKRTKVRGRHVCRKHAKHYRPRRSTRHSKQGARR
jgi:hypothetical protein